MATVSAQPVSLCVDVMPLQQSMEAGQTASWAVAVWAEGGNVASAALKLAATPAGAGTPAFSYGCGNDDGTASCDLGAVDASSAARQLQAQVTIPQTPPVSAVTLTATISATGLTTAPQASGSVTIVAAAPPVPVSGTGASLPPFGVTPATPGTTLNPGGSAAGLFPAITPSTPAGAHGPAPASEGPASEGAVPAANASALPGGSDSVDAQIAGLAALALAVLFAVTRVSPRRRSRPRPGDTAATTAAKEAAAGQAAHDEKDGT